MRIQNLLTLALFSTLLMAPALAQVGFTIQLGQPNYYGGLNLQGYPNPQYYNTNPVLIEPNLASYGQPVYLRVPPGQRQNWRSYCGRYNACNRKVYFVQDNWYNSVYAPRYRSLNNGQYRSNPGNDHGNGKNQGHGNG
ncbi:MAG: hypothetical protein WBM08_02355 [Prochlorococcaceae cyanobacterium]